MYEPAVIAAILKEHIEGHYPDLTVEIFQGPDFDDKSDKVLKVYINIKDVLFNFCSIETRDSFISLTDTCGPDKSFNDINAPHYSFKFTVLWRTPTTQPIVVDIDYCEPTFFELLNKFIIGIKKTLKRC